MVLLPLTLCSQERSHMDRGNICFAQFLVLGDAVNLTCVIIFSLLSGFELAQPSTFLCFFLSFAHTRCTQERSCADPAPHARVVGPAILEWKSEVIVYYVICGHDDSTWMSCHWFAVQDKRLKRVSRERREHHWLYFLRAERHNLQKDFRYRRAMASQASSEHA